MADAVPVPEWRDRDAERGGRTYRLDGRLDPDEVEALADGLRGPRREVVVRATDTGEDWPEATEDVVVLITVADLEGLSTIDLLLPCLQVAR